MTNALGAMSEKALLVKQYSQILAQQNGWSTAYAEGYLEGKHQHRHELSLGAYARVGIDEYALGFRAGYFERKNVASTQIHTFSASEIESTLQSK